MKNDDLTMIGGQSIVAKKRVYRCDNGHEIVVEGGGTWTMFLFQQTTGGKTESHEFNYCPRCFGAWAAAKFPTSEVKDED